MMIGFTFRGSNSVIFIVASQIKWGHLMKERAGLPRSGKNVWKMNFFLGQGKVREFCGWPGKFRKDLESQGKVREFENR